MQAEVTPALGEKVFEASCKLSIPPSPPTDGRAEIWTEGLVLKPNLGRTVFVPFTETAKLDASNYRVNVTTATETLSLLALGTSYEHFSQKLVDSWGDALEGALLMREPVTLFETRATYSQPGQGPQSAAMARLRIHPTSLIVLPANAFPRKIPLSSIVSAKLEGYKLQVTTSTDVYEFSKMGNQTQYAAEKVTSTQRALETSALETLRSMLPSGSYDELRRLSMIVPEGQAAMRKDVEAISPDLWHRLEQRVAESPLAESYSHLSSLGEKNQEAIGLRKTEDNVYVWYLILARGSVATGGNALIMEVTSETGHATYLFWVVKRQDFPNIPPEQFLQEGEHLIRELNEAMIATGFRREPIYLSDDQLNSPPYAKYLFASKNLEPLRFLRERFFARIIHHDTEQWKSDLADAILFNTSTTDKRARWAKSELDLFESQPTPSTGTSGTEIVETKIPATPSILQTAPPGIAISQSLNLQREAEPVVSQPVLANAIERALTVNRIESYEEGKLRIFLTDDELNHETAVVLKTEDAGRLGAFPGTKVKLSLQKI